MNFKWSRKIESAKAPYLSGVMFTTDPSVFLSNMVPRGSEAILFKVIDPNDATWKGFVTYSHEGEIKRADLWRI